MTVLAPPAPAPSAFSPYTDIHSPPATLGGLLGDLRTIASLLISGVNISSSAVSICVDGAAVNHTISLFSPLSSLPHILLWPSIYYNTSSGNYKQAQISGNSEFTQLYINQNTINTNLYNASTRAVLQLLPSDNRDDNIQLCNGVGKCNFQTGSCSCPFVSDTAPIYHYMMCTLTCTYHCSCDRGTGPTTCWVPAEPSWPIPRGGAASRGALALSTTI